MSANQCKNCGGLTEFNNKTNSPFSSGYSMLNPSHHHATSMITIGNTHVKAKIMWGTVSAINELRDKERR